MSLFTVLSAAERVALVIGNQAYRHTTVLNNPGNDARGIATVLRRLSFDVDLQTDIDYRAMRSAVRRFSTRLEGAEVGIFYYAGHALQVDGRNYLAPVDARLADKVDLHFEAVSLDLVLTQLEREPRTSLVFLDACRDNPLARNLARSMGFGRSAAVGRGLSRVSAGIGTLVTYATQPGNIAEDGTGRNSPFTAALLSHIETPGLEVRQVLTRVRNDVLSATGGRQVPWDHSSLTGDFYFVVGGSLIDEFMETEYGEDASAVHVKTSPPAYSGEIAISQNWIEPATGIAFVWVPGGCFWMGQVMEARHQVIKALGKKVYKENFKDELPHHEVCVDGFWMGRYEVTQGQWRQVMGTNPSKYRQGNNYPVESVSWSGVQKFIKKLNSQAQNSFRLPTEAEWEYAARAGTRAVRYWGHDSARACLHANIYDAESKLENNFGWQHHACNDGYATAAPVGTFSANEFGLYDILGNVWEWVNDRYGEDYYRSSPRTNPKGPGAGDSRLYRGGGWDSDPTGVRAAVRGRATPEYRNRSLGFRLIRENHSE